MKRKEEHELERCSIALSVLYPDGLTKANPEEPGNKILNQWKLERKKRGLVPIPQKGEGE